MQQNDPLDNGKYCSCCQRPLAPEYEKEMCPACEEFEFFSRVKDYIRTHDVTEYQLAEEFQIPLRRVKDWIKEGRIEYKEGPVKKLQELRCAGCGEPIQFGTLCQKCYRLKNTPKGTAASQKDEDSRMRFLE